MPRARFQLQPAFLLNARPYSDSSLLLEAFTTAQGRIGLIARGARSPRSRTRAQLQPLQPLLLSWQEAGELGTLTGVEADGAAITLAGERVFYAWYLNELLLRLLPRHDPHPVLFERYAQTLPALSGTQPEAPLRVFEKHLLAEIGYGLQLDAPLQMQQQYRYDETQGPVAVPGQGSGTVSGASLMALRDEGGWSDAALTDARKLLRPLIARQLGGVPLQSARLLRQLRGTVSSHEPPDES